MAIQDQCNRCKKNGTSESCSKVSFDGNSCERYVSKKQEQPSSTASIAKVDNLTAENKENVRTFKTVKNNTKLYYAIVVGVIAIAGWIVGDYYIGENVSEESSTKQEQRRRRKHTDCNITFVVPSGFSCKEEHDKETGESVYRLYGARDRAISISCDYDDDISEKHFLERWTKWTDESRYDYLTSTSTSIHATDSGYIYYHKLSMMEIDADLAVVWHFVTIFHQKTGKVCIVSYYRPNEKDNVLEDFLNSIRFEK